MQSKYVLWCLLLSQVQIKPDFEIWDTLFVNKCMSCFTYFFSVLSLKTFADVSSNQMWRNFWKTSETRELPQGTLCWALRYILQFWPIFEYLRLPSSYKYTYWSVWVNILKKGSHATNKVCCGFFCILEWKLHFF